jgi:L-Lysine epsilon oxidase N-terminal/L-lysine epsilon oxidase C-terminal domain
LVTKKGEWSLAKRYKIHPAIGFARVGNSTEFFLAPEVPGAYARPDRGTYRDANQLLKRQAVRFRVFEYDDAKPRAAPKPVTLGGKGAARIEWTVHLVNAKAAWFEFAGITGEGPAGYPPGHPLRNHTVTGAGRQQLVIDPLARTVSADGTETTTEVTKGTSGSPAAETWPPALTGGGKIEALGTLGVDAQGRLTVAGGFGTSGTPGPLPPSGHLAYDNNDNWFDDVSDGPVTARVVLANGTALDATPAWVIVAPPDFAPPIENVVTIYDLLYDLGLREFGLDPEVFDPTIRAFNPKFTPSFTQDVYPLLRRALDYRWVIAEAEAHSDGGLFDLTRLAAAPQAGETPASNPRAKVFARLRDPDNLTAPGGRSMPRLHNDCIGNVPPETLRFSVTRYQFFVMKQWAAGKFMADWAGKPPARPDPQAAVTADGLDRASLEAACGGSFFPGMEAGWILRDPRVYVSPFEFRFRHAAEPNGMIPGSATKRMALPWQADFLDCSTHWWPAQRPNQVVGPPNPEWDRGVTSSVHMVEVWSRLGVVAPDPATAGSYVETERTLPEPP